MCRGTKGYARPCAVLRPAEVGEEDDVRALCACALLMLAGGCVTSLLETQYDQVVAGELVNLAMVDELVAECRAEMPNGGYDSWQDCYRMAAAEELGLIQIDGVSPSTLELF